MKPINHVYTQRMNAASKCIEKLSALDIAIEHIDINRAIPVLTVSLTRATEKLGGAIFMWKGQPQRRVSRKQVQFENCRIEWEAQL